MTIYLLDTNIVVSLIRGLKVRPNPNAQQRERHRTATRILTQARQKHAAGHQIALSAITVAELEFGARNSGDYPLELAATRRAISAFQLLPFDAEDCAVHYGAIRHFMESGGRPIGSLDMLIAAQALALRATMVTNDSREFSRVPDLELEDWSE